MNNQSIWLIDRISGGVREMYLSYLVDLLRSGDDCYTDGTWFITTQRPAGYEAPDALS